MRNGGLWGGCAAFVVLCSWWSERLGGDESGCDARRMAAGGV